MAADDELPRGLTLTDNTAVNQVGSVTFPASAGIAWVLTNVSWKAYADGETIAQQGTIEVLSPAAVLDAFIINVQTGWQEDSGSWQGQIAGPVGAALEVQFSGGISGGYENLVAAAYPV